MTLLICDPFGRFVLSVSITLSSAGFEAVIPIVVMLLPGDSESH